MKCALDISDELERVFSKLAKKNKKQLLIIHKKVEEIRENSYHFKPLHGDMKVARRVHIDKSFILIYEVNEEHKVVRLLDYDHHDNID